MNQQKWLHFMGMRYSSRHSEISPQTWGGALYGAARLVAPVGMTCEMWGMLNHIDPQTHQWSVSTDKAKSFRPLRAFVPDTNSAPGIVMKSNVYGLLLLDSGPSHTTYQVKLLHDPTTQPATQP
jgi:hypothetical protein